MEKSKEEINNIFTDSSVDNEKGIKLATSVFIQGIWYARIIRAGKNYDFKIKNWEIGEAKRVYSLPKNEVYPTWTRKELNRKVNIVANKYWSKFKPKLAIQGYILDNKFIVK
jgi:hypothetical protein